MIVLSDLHFGDGSKADDFGPAHGLADSALLSKLAEWKMDGKEVVLAGDIFDLWQADYESIMRAHGRVIRRLMAMTTLYVPGNHDAGILSVGEDYLSSWYFKTGYLFTINDGVYITHGHQFDPVISRFPRLVAVLSRAVGWLERRVHKDIDQWGERLARWVGCTGRYGSAEKYARKVAEEAYKWGCNVAVFGHTHEKAEWIFTIKGKIITVWNCGTWTNGKQDYIKL